MSVKQRVLSVRDLTVTITIVPFPHGNVVLARATYGSIIIAEGSLRHVVSAIVNYADIVSDTEREWILSQLVRELGMPPVIALAGGFNGRSN